MMFLRKNIYFYLSLFALISSISLYIYYANNPLVYDDLNQFLLNSKLHNIFNLKDVIFCDVRQIRFFQNFTLAIDWTISDFNPWASRVQNLLWLFIDVFLFIKIVDFLNPLTKLEKLIFFSYVLILPIQIQSVHYAMARTTLIQSFFYFLLFYLFLKDKNKILISLGIIISMLCKETCVLIPVTFILYDLLLSGKKICEIKWNDHYLYLISTMFILVVYHYLKDPLSMYVNVTGFTMYPVGEYLLTQFYYLVFYIYLFFSPASQAILHEYPHFSDTVFFVGLGGIVLILMALAVLWKLRKTRKDISFTILLFFIAWLPVNSVMQMVNPFAEYRYLTCNICFAYLFYSLMKSLIRKFNIPHSLVLLTTTLYFIFNLIFMNNILSTYSGQLKVYGYALQIYPESPRLNAIVAEFYTSMLSKANYLTSKYSGNQNFDFLKVKIKDFESNRKFYYENSYKLYHQNPIPFTLIYDNSLINYYIDIKDYKKACLFSDQVKIKNKYEFYQIDNYYQNYLKCLNKTELDANKISEIEKKYYEYINWFNTIAW